MPTSNHKSAIAQRAASIAPSLTLAITAKAKKMQEDGVKVVGFGAGEPDFNTPDYIIAAAKNALDKGLTKYTPSSGILPLRQAICQKFKKDNGLTYAPNQIVVSNGAKHSLHNACQAIIEGGDEVIIPSPYWLTYPELVGIAGGKCVFVETSAKNSFCMTPEQLEAAITKKTKAVIINSPSNPTGGIYSEKDLRALAAVIQKHPSIYVISDEIYENLVYDGKKHFSIAAVDEDMYNRTIVVNGMSKTYSMTGWRIGYTACEPKLAAVMDNMQSHTTSNPNSIAQYAALEAIASPEGDKFLSQLVTTFDSRRKAMAARLAKMPLISHVVPSGAFYFMVDITKLKGKTIGGVKIKAAQEVAEILLTQAEIAVVPGEAFGAPDYIRLSYALAPADMERGLDKLENFLNNIK
ncbi:MAG: pyridoxal phosphate-dependent aminotransferase [Firmicutes bacterium]|nr:pyridoxal phosphate-dependent aminotransferase [Bacillota bacterium]